MESLLAYANSLMASTDILWWLENVAKKYIKSGVITESQVEHIIDWMASGDAPKRLQRMSLKDAQRLSVAWMNANKKKGADLTDSSKDIKNFMKFKDGSRIVKREGNLMSHCLGGYDIRKDFDIYSLRDEKNLPHATFEVAKDQKEFLQIKGKGNGPIHPKYIDRVLAFLKKLGFDLRPTDMVNLGYYRVDPVHLDLVKNKIGKNEKLVQLNKEFYVV